MTQVEKFRLAMDFQALYNVRQHMFSKQVASSPRGTIDPECENMHSTPPEPPAWGWPFDAATDAALRQ